MLKDEQSVSERKAIIDRARDKIAELRARQASQPNFGKPKASKTTKVKISPEEKLAMEDWKRRQTELPLDLDSET